MASFFCGKRHWESHKGLLSQIHGDNLPVATSEDFMENLSDSFGFMLDSKPLGNVLDESQVQKLEFFVDTNIPFVLFCSTLKDLLITKPDWIFTIPSSNCKGSIEEIVEVPKKKIAQKSKSHEEEEKEIPSWNEILGDTTAESKQQKQPTTSFNSNARTGERVKQPLQATNNTHKTGRLLTRPDADRHSDSEDDNLFDDDDDGSTTTNRGKKTETSKLSTPASVPKSTRDTSSTSGTTRQQSPQQDSLHQVGRSNSGKTPRSGSSSKQGKYARFHQI